MNWKELKAFVEQLSDSVDNFECMPTLIQAIKEFEEKEDDREESNFQLIINFTDRKMFSAAKKSKGKHSKTFVELAIVMAEKKMSRCYEALKYLSRERSIVNWKEYSNEAIQIIETFKVTPEIKMTERDEKYFKETPLRCEMCKRVEDCAEYLVKAFVRDKIMNKVGPNLIELLIHCLKKGDPMKLMIAKGIADNWGGEIKESNAKTLVPELLRTIDEWTRSVDDTLQNEEYSSEQRIAYTAMRVGFDSNCPPDLYIKHMESIWLNAMTKELEGDPMTGWGNIVNSILTNFMMPNATAVDLTKMIPGTIKLIKSDIKTLKTQATNLIGCRMHQKVDALVPYADDVVDVLLEEENKNLGSVIKPLYAKCPEKIVARMKDILDQLCDMNVGTKSYMYFFFGDVSKDNSELFLPYIDTFLDDVTTPNIEMVVLMFLGELAQRYPEKFINHVDSSLEVLKTQPTALYHVNKIIACVGTINKEKAIEVLQILVDQLPTVQIVYVPLVLMEMKKIGHKFPECLSTHREKIEAMKDTPQTGVPETIASIIDFLEGRTLENLHDGLTEQQESINQLDTRVTTTEKNVDEVTKKVEKHDEDIAALQTDVAEQGQKLEELEEVVDETVAKVEEIDHKTITNAPKWSREVAKILNPEAEYDWRFLAIRLGYSGEDIRNWALSPDPTMAILAEWYTTHKSSDATYAILTALEDMGQVEAVKIVEDSLEKADSTVPKNESETPTNPPKVFISYQWDHQPEVKVIREHLEMAGFDCWMDIGQMGGGDNLYAKINEGMRAAKVVLCMTTEKYSKSENCNKEVNLANLLNKPIIPILIERTQWPPEGPMSMLFAQLLYIQFFTEKEYVRGDKFWFDSKFAELLAQVSYYATPDPEKITEEYKNWVPTVEAPKQEVKKATDEAKTTDNKVKSEQSEKAPEVFISYQWDHQPQIKILYQRLTNLGYSCWLDIKQMGGGDPLYSKIDKGLRKAKVVVSCVTPKYSLSANCRREVSLSDALRRPIIPILLQQMSWPPEGPMSMTFTQLLYIDFTKESSQENFNDEKFDELLLKINEHAQPSDLKIEVVKSATPECHSPENNAEPENPVNELIPESEQKEFVSEPESIPKAETIPNTDIVSQSVSESEQIEYIPKPEPVPDSEFVEVPETNPETETEPELPPETQNKPELGADPKSKSDSIPVPLSEIESDTRPEPVPVSGSSAEPSETVSEPLPDKEYNPKPEYVSQQEQFSSPEIFPAKETVSSNKPNSQPEMKNPPILDEPKKSPKSKACSLL